MRLTEITWVPKLVQNLERWNQDCPVQRESKRTKIRQFAKDPWESRKVCQVPPVRLLQEYLRQCHQPQKTPAVNFRVLIGIPSLEELEATEADARSPDGQNPRQAPTVDGQTPAPDTMGNHCWLAVTGESYHSGFLNGGAKWISQPSTVFSLFLFGGLRAHWAIPTPPLALLEFLQDRLHQEMKLLSFLFACFGPTCGPLSTKIWDHLKVLQKKKHPRSLFNFSFQGRPSEASPTHKGPYYCPLPKTHFLSGSSKSPKLCLPPVTILPGLTCL